MSLYGLVSFVLRLSLLISNAIALILCAIYTNIVSIILCGVSIILLSSSLGVDVRNPSTPQTKRRVLISLDVIVLLLLLADAILYSIDIASYEENGDYVYSGVQAVAAFVWISFIVDLAVVVWDILLLVGVLQDDSMPGKPWLTDEKDYLPQSSQDAS